MLENIENTAVCPSFLSYVSVFFGNPKKLGHLLLSNVRPNKGRCILYSNYIISMCISFEKLGIFYFPVTLSLWRALGLIIEII